jgi:hypothetical protein
VGLLCLAFDAITGEATFLFSEGVVAPAVAVSPILLLPSLAESEGMVVIGGISKTITTVHYRFGIIEHC